MTWRERNLKWRGGARSGFSLVELLVALAIAAIITAISVPAISGIVRAQQLTSAGQVVVNQLVFARQTAVSSSHAVQVRFYYLPDYNTSSPASDALAVYRGMQTFVESDPTATGPTLSALTKPQFFTSPVVISSTAAISPFLPATPTTPSGTDPSLPNFQKNYKYAMFRYRPDGSTDQAGTPVSFTIVLKNAQVVANNLPANYQTVQINPMLGSVRSFRP